MAFNKKTEYGESLNILESEVGLVVKTRQGTQEMASDIDGRKAIKAGTLYEGDGTGVVLQDYDMTDRSEYPISVVFQGRLKADRVSAEALAKKDTFKNQGLYLI